MNDISAKTISKTVQRRQLKRLRPKHYEIITRMFMGQKQKQIAKDMGIGYQRLSVIVNSPVFQEEVSKRLQVREEEVITRIREQEKRRWESIRSAAGKPRPQREKREEKPKVSHQLPEGIAESIIRSLAQTRAKEIEPLADPRPIEASKMEPKPETIAQPVNATNARNETPAKRDSTPTPQVQAAKFYSQTLGQWIWLLLDYPGEKTAYYEALPLLRLTNGTAWKIVPRSFTPSDGYSCYFGDEIPQLRGKSPEELRSLHQKRGLNGS